MRAASANNTGDAESAPPYLAEALENACTGLALDPESLRAEMSDDDVADIEAGRIPPETIRAYAELVAQRQGSTASEPTAEPWTADELDEAAEERQAIIEESTGREAETIARAARAFYAHIFGEAQRTGCCRAPLGSYCETGARLRAEYEATASDGVPFPEMPTAYRNLSNEGTT
jgi:hypothetical protein